MLFWNEMLILMVLFSGEFTVDTKDKACIEGKVYNTYINITYTKIGRGYISRKSFFKESK